MFFTMGYVLLATPFLIINVAAYLSTVPTPPFLKTILPYEQLYQVAQTSDEPDKPFGLDCEAEGNPEPTYLWRKNGKYFEYGSYGNRIILQPSKGTLYFTKPLDMDEGFYQCYVKNVYGTAVSNTVYLRKSLLNSFAEGKSREIFVKEGDPMSLECNSPTSYPKPTIFWVIQTSSGSLRSINSSRITVDCDGRLHFSNFTREDSLEECYYVCSVVTVVSANKNEYEFGMKKRLRVKPAEILGESKYPPIKQYLSPSNIVALRGQKLQLSCIFGGTPLPDIVWTKKGSTLFDKRFTYTDFGKTLQMKSIEFQDEGNYSCVGSNGVGRPISHFMAVKVESSPYWLSYPNNTEISENENATFTCTAMGKPEPTLQWYVNGVPFEKISPNSRREKAGNVVTILRVLKTDTAVYQCNASNVHGYVFKNFYLNVLSLPPTITGPPESVTRAVVSSNVVLKCRVFGAPTPSVTWTKTGPELKGSRFKVLENGDLEISKIKEADQGMYTCYARNKYDIAQASGQLVVLDDTNNIIPEPSNVKIPGIDPRILDQETMTDTEDTKVLAAGVTFGDVESAPWFIVTMCAIAILIVALVIGIIIRVKRGGRYHVQEREIAHGRDESYKSEGGISEYNVFSEPHKPVLGSRTTLNSSYKSPESDTDSMSDYSDEKGVKFEEDGSFIGRYGEKARKQATSTPSSSHKIV